MATQCIIRQCNRGFVALARFSVEVVQLAVLFVDNAVLAVGARPADIPGLFESDLCSFPGRDVVGIQIEVAVAIRIKKYSVADPHGIATGAFGVGYFLRFVAPQVKNVELVGLAAGIAFLGAEIARARRINHLLTVWRKSTGPGFWHRQSLGRPTLDRNAVEPADGQRIRIPQRTKDHVAAIVGPAIHLIVVAPAWRERPSGGVKRELFRHATRGRHDVNLLVAVVLPGERNPLAVGREFREYLDARMRGQSNRRAASDRSLPT